MTNSDNVDQATVSGFGLEWSKYDQSDVPADELLGYFNSYFSVFPWDQINSASVGFDLGCGSGRWANLVAPKVGRLHCIDASQDALTIARQNLRQHANCSFHRNSVAAIDLPDSSMDFGYSLGVLHHVPDTLGGIRSCVAKLKPGAPFLLYLYYRFDNKPAWYRSLWSLSDQVRRAVSRLPHERRLRLTQLLAGCIYWPLARTAKTLESFGIDIADFPLSSYRNASLYTMKTDALDRFGTALEQRFTRDEIAKMMCDANLERVTFSNSTPFWCAVGYRVR